MFQSSPSYQSHFSYHTFSLLSQLAHLSQPTCTHQPPSTSLTFIKQLQQAFAKTPSNKYDTALFTFMKARTQFASLSVQQQQDPNGNLLLGLQQSFRNFLGCFSETKVRVGGVDNMVQNLDKVMVVVGDKKRVYSLKEELNRKRENSKGGGIKNNNSNNNSSKNNQGGNAPYTKANDEQHPHQQPTYKAYVIYGKAVNVQKPKKPSLPSSTQPLPPHSPPATSPSQPTTTKQHLTTSLQLCLTTMYQQQKLPYVKSQPHQLEDILLTHPLEESGLLPVLVTHEVWRWFVPVEGVVLLVVPQEIVENARQEVPFIVKNTLLHVFADCFRMVNKLVTREAFFKSVNFRGIYFVQEGEVETKSGRIVARGWVINGKCKSTTVAWRFTKIMSFFKFILDNDNIWKQFVNDLKLNGEWPIKISDVLNLDEKVFEEMMGEEGAGFKLNGNQRQNRLKFPPISARLNKSFDIAKLSEIERMKHYDQKMNHLNEYKQEMFRRKMEIGSKKSSVYIQGQAAHQASQRQMNKLIQIISQKMNLPHKGLKTDVSRSVILRSGESASNILVTGIVKKLKSMHESDQEKGEVGRYGEGSSRRMKEGSREKTKILGLKRYEEILKGEKQHLYKGKNFYC